MSEPIKFTERDLETLLVLLARERRRIIRHANRKNTTLRPSVASMMLVDNGRLTSKVKGLLHDVRYAVEAPDQAEAGRQDREGDSQEEGRQGSPA